jgi:hypothetical protein
MLAPVGANSFARRLAENCECHFLTLGRRRNALALVARSLYFQDAVTDVQAQTKQLENGGVYDDNSGTRQRR